MPHFDSCVHRPEKLTGGVRCLTTNLDCLPNKLDELENFLKFNNIDIAALVETIPKKCPNEQLRNLKFNISDYDCITNSAGRGIALYVNNEFEIIERYQEYEHLCSPSIFCKIKTNNKESFILGVVYRSPNSTQVENESLLKLLDQFSSKFKSNSEKLLLVGDLNCPDINWSDGTCNKPPDHFQSRILNKFHQYYFTQFIKEPTHKRPNQNETLIDLVLSNYPDFVHSIVHQPPLGKSHHSTICFNIDVETPTFKPSREVKYCMDKGDFDGMRKYMQGIEWGEVLKDEDSVDVWWDLIESTINKAKDIFIPKKKVFNKPRDKHITHKRTFATPDTLLKKIKLKRYAFKTYKKFPTMSNYNIYAKYRNQVTRETRKAKKQKEIKVAKDAKVNPKAFFQYVNNKLKPKDNISNLLKEDGTLTTNDQEKSEVLNKFFASVFTFEDTEDVPVFTCDNDHNIFDIFIDNPDMGSALKFLNVNKSPGPDGLHPRILSELHSELSKPLASLFNKTMIDCKLPSKWKSAEVRPIFKKGSKTSPGNYRPVSLTSIVCKVFEGFVRNDLFKHLVSNNLLAEEQYGFCSKRSCTTQLLNTINDWFIHLDEKTPVDAVYLDFRKAFDTVPHERLLSKLHGYGVRGNVLNWVRDFLEGRSQYVAINGERSTKIPVTSGVPQGSVLGPTLFIYFINDLPQVAGSSLKIFADDTKAYVPLKDESDSHKLQETIDSLVEWSEKWLLKFNNSKCKVLHLGKNNPCYQYTIHEESMVSYLAVTTCEKDLGVHIDPFLNFNEHVNYIVNKSRSLSGLIMRVITFKTPEIMVPLFKSLIRPILEYANAVWCPYKRMHIDIIEKIQRHYTKRVEGMKDMSYSERLEAMRLPSLEFRRLRGDLIETFKMTHNLYDPITTSSLLTLSQSNTRNNSYKLTKPRVKSRKFQSFFTNRIINAWNQLPFSAVNVGSVNEFKNEIDDIFKDYMYCTNFILR